MSEYNFINQARVEVSTLCKYDTCNGYASDFSFNGNVNGWDQASGLHTWGVWSNFLFATLIGTSGYIGRSNVFVSVPAESFYTVKIAMKFHPTERVSKPSPTTCKLMWRTLANINWSSDRTMEFPLYSDDSWHEYVLNMGEHPYWVGNVNDLRFYPTIDGQEDDEFFIRNIKITSVSTYRCLNGDCDYHNNYEHPCRGAGQRAFCKSAKHGSSHFDIQDDSEIVININDYGNEIIKLKAIDNGSGNYVATKLASEISKVGIGGYSEVSVVYDDNRFIIYSGTITNGSSVVIKDGNLSRQLKFFDEAGSTFTSSNGTTPASGFKPASSFHISTFRLLELFDNDSTTELRFDPFGYAIEGGRSDWVSNGVGFGTTAEGAGTGSEPSGGIPLPNRVNRFYPKLNGAGKTLIDFTHPFNASGRIKKLFVACTLDVGFEQDPDSDYKAWEYENGRIELSGAKVKIFRPKRDGSLEVIFSTNIVDRDRSSGALYSEHQETIEIDCDVWVNKGDLIGVYNANLYLGKTLDDTTVDAMYFSVDGEVTGSFNPGPILGDGVSGLMLYARSDYQQSCLFINADLETRTSVSSISVIGETESINLEYNIASCQDINWQVDLFSGEHKCKYLKQYPGEGTGPVWTSYTLQNTAYGIDLLSDNKRYNLDGKAADSFTCSDSGGVIPTNPKYFYVNGDGEWLGIHQLILRGYNWHGDQHVIEFEEDPIAFDLFFPYNKPKTIYKSVVYFKEINNFRNFSLSTYNGPYDSTGNAESQLFTYVPEYTVITLDGKKTEINSTGYDSLKDYLFKNPTNILPEKVKTGGPINYGDGIIVTNYEIINNEEYMQAANTDWQTIEHEFEPIKCYGFRIYCDLHKSTKINEIEIYGLSRELSTSLIGGTTIRYSFYSDIWWNVELDEADDGSVEAYIGDTPRYITIELNPVTSSIFKDINLFVDTDSIYVGEKGCEYQLLIDNSKVGVDNEASVVDIKNVYDGNYDLYVDIADSDKKEAGLVYHSVMNNAESISNPEVGPDGSYTKQDDYSLVNVNGNVAINCDCWGLKNLIDQKKVYYSYTDGFNWFRHLNCEMVVDKNQEGTHDTAHVDSPSVIKDGSTYKMWYSGSDGTNYRILYTISSDGINWIAPQMVLNYNTQGVYDTSDVKAPCVIKEFDTSYKMWYSANDDVCWKILYAISIDGITWTDHQMVLSSTNIALGKTCDQSDNSYPQYPASNAVDGDLSTFQKLNVNPSRWWKVDLGEIYEIYYIRMIKESWGTPTIYNIQTADDYDFTINVVDIITENNEQSSNIIWTVEDFGTVSTRYLRVLCPVSGYQTISMKEFEVGLVGDKEIYNGTYAPCVIKESDISYKMWCCGKGTDNWKVVHTTSTDGIVWSDSQIVIDKDVIGTYDSSYVREPWVIKESDTFYKMWYSAYDGTNWRILYATSVDGVVWTDHKSMLDQYTEETYGVSDSYAPCVIKESSELYKMWYSGYNSYWSILYTELESSLTAGDKSLSFENMPGYRSTIINLPTLIRDRYWKFSWDSDEFSMKVYEAHAYKDGKLMDVVMYENVGSGPMVDVATYLQDGNLTSGYFTMNSSNSLGIDLGVADYIDSLVLIHEDTTIDPEGTYPIVNGSYTANDIYTRLNIRGIDGQIKDYSYYEYDILTTGSGISLDQGKFDIGTSNTTGIKFSGHDDSYMYVPHNVDIALRTNLFNIDFFVKFDTLPASGIAIPLASNWEGPAPDRALDETWTHDDTKSWVILIRNTGSSCHFEFWVNMWTRQDSSHRYWMAHGLWIDDIDIDIGIHYHVGLNRAPEYTASTNIRAYVDGVFQGYVATYASNYATKFPNPELPIVIGKDVDGVITEFRYSLSMLDSYIGPGGEKYLSSQYWRQHQRFFKLNIEISADNSFYSSLGSVDAMFNTEYYHHIEGSRYNSLYDTHLLIDLEKRHDLQLLRSYGKSDALSVSLDHFNSSYSSEDISDPSLINFGRELSYDDVTNSFVGTDYSDINTDLWKIGNVGESINSKMYIKNNMLYMKNAEYTNTTMWIESKFIIKGLHNVQLDYILDEHSNNNYWRIYLYIVDSLNTDGWWARRGYDVWANSYQTAGNTYSWHFSTSETFGSMRFCRFVSDLYQYNNTFFATDNGVWRKLDNIIVDGATTRNFKVRIYLEIGDNCPTTSAFLNLKVNYAGGIYLPQIGSDYNDARWAQIRVPNDEIHYVRKLGIYSDLTKQLGPGGGYYNCEWDFLGEAVTNYSEGVNVALGATVSGSSVFSSMPLVNLTDGKVGSGFYNAWGSDQTGNPVVNVDLGEVYSIYRVKIYHGYNVDDSTFIVKNYTISYSADDITYTDIFNISGNTSFERTHDLTNPVDAKYVKITITNFDAGVVILRETDGSLQTFEGAVIREIEVNKYYGYSIINSEEYPIIAVNMKDQFHLNSHSLVGIDSEDTNADWDNSESNFSYSDQIWDNPGKITFSDWGNGLGFNQWVVLKRDTATNYNSGPDYLKHLVISSNNLPNPCDHPWWWDSNLSTLSRDFSYPVEYGISILKIEYPSSDGLDIISYKELEGFGIDQNAAWRDGISFRLRVDDVDNIDFSEGYFYFAGKDATSEENNVEYRWNLSTVSGAISTGWSSLILPFKYADEVIYMDPLSADEYDPRIPENILFTSVGLMFKGKGNALTLHLDGFEIKRCHFNEYSAFDKGLYLVKDDFVYAPIGEFNPSYGTIEFWLRPDYTLIGKDFYNVIKTRGLFHFSNNQNDVFGAAFTTNGLEVYRGNVTNDTVVSSVVSYIGIDLMDQVIHLGITYSNNGKKIDSDGSTLRVYMNNVLVAKSFNTWDVQDKKHFTFIFGGNSPVGLRVGGVIQSSSVDGVVSNFKIYNYCKTDFSGALQNIEEGNVNNLFKTSELIEISNNNLTFFKVGSPNLPLLYEEVQSGETAKVYVKTIIPEGLTGKEKRTPNLIVSWNVAV